MDEIPSITQLIFLEVLRRTMRARRAQASVAVCWSGPDRTGDLSSGDIDQYRLIGIANHKTKSHWHVYHIYVYIYLPIYVYI